MELKFGTKMESSASMRKRSRKNVTADPCFDQAWALYPRKAAKVDAIKAWNQVVTAPLFMTQDILAAIERMLPEWSTRPMRFIPLFATWLRGERWHDPTEDNVVRFPIERIVRHEFTPEEIRAMEIEIAELKAKAELRK